MYFINEGSVLLVHKSTETYIGKLKNENFFGEISFFSRRPRCISVKSNAFTEVLYLTWESFINISKEYPEDRDTFKNIYNRTKLPNGNIAELGMICYVC